MRAYEINQGDFFKNMEKKNIKNMFDKCDTYSEINKTYKKALRMFDSIPMRQVEKANGLELA